MLALDAFKKEWRELTYYGRFEKIALRAVLFLLGVITAYTIVLVGIQLFDDLRLGESFLEKAALQETFGSILTSSFCWNLIIRSLWLLRKDLAPFKRELLFSLPCWSSLDN